MIFLNLLEFLIRILFLIVFSSCPSGYILKTHKIHKLILNDMIKLKINISIKNFFKKTNFLLYYKYD